MNVQFPFAIFKSDVTPYLCPYCYQILNKPVKYKNYKIGCHTCVLKKVKQDRNVVSNREVRFCSNLEKDIDNLKVTCSNTNCPWVGRKGNFLQHREVECAYSDNECSLPCCKEPAEVSYEQFFNKLGSNIEQKCQESSIGKDIYQGFSKMKIEEIEQKFLSLAEINKNLVSLDSCYKERRDLSEAQLEKVMFSILSGFVYYTNKLEFYASKEDKVQMKNSFDMVKSYSNSSEYLESILYKAKYLQKGINSVFRKIENKNYIVENDIIEKKNNSGSYLLSDVRLAKGRYRLRVSAFELKWPERFKIGFIFSKSITDIEKSTFYEVSIDSEGVLRNDFGKPTVRDLKFMRVPNSSKIYIISIDLDKKEILYDVGDERFKIKEIGFSKKMKATAFCWINYVGEKIEIELLDEIADI